MPFGTVSGVGRGMGIINRCGDRRRGSGILGVNVGHSTVSNGDDDMLFPNYFGEGFVTYY